MHPQEPQRREVQAESRRRGDRRRSERRHLERPGPHCHAAWPAGKQRARIVQCAEICRTCRLGEDTKDHMKDKKLVVTGASGFVGSHLVEALLADGASVHAFVRYNSGHRIGHLAELPEQLRSDLRVRLGDLRDLDAVHALIDGADTVFHLGALGSVPYSYQDPLAFVDVNVAGTANVLRACVEHRVSRLLLMSTSEVYGSAQYIPIDEIHPLRAQSPYAASKIAAEKFAESFGCAFGLPVTIVRCFNIYGQRQSRRNVIPALLGQALSSSSIHVGYLDSVRDYTYVTDSIQAIAELAFNQVASG